MDDASLAHQPSEGAVRQRAERLAQQSCQRLGDAVRRYRPCVLAVIGHQCTVSGPAEAVRLLQDRVEHRPEVAGRAVDHLQDLGGRGLLFQCLAGLGDQTGVLDRDHRLVGKILQQRDLFVGKRPHLPATGRDGPDQRLVLAKGHSQCCTCPGEAGSPSSNSVGSIRLLAREIGELHHGFAPRNAVERNAWTGAHGSSDIAADGRGEYLKAWAVKGPEGADIGFAKPPRLFQHSVEHRREIAR